MKIRWLEYKIQKVSWKGPHKTDSENKKKN